jgi:hypothetical protein
MSDEDLARQLVDNLIADVKAKVAPRATQLEDRIEKTLAFFDQVTAPNVHTVTHARKYLTGEYDELHFTNPAATLREAFERRWVCRVVSTGYHNGAGCDPSDPHGPDWRCGYRWSASLTDKQAREMGLTTEEDTTS